MSQNCKSERIKSAGSSLRWEASQWKGTGKSVVTELQCNVGWEPKKLKIWISCVHFTCELHTWTTTLDQARWKYRALHFVWQLNVVDCKLPFFFARLYLAMMPRIELENKHTFHSAVPVRWETDLEASGEEKNLKTFQWKVSERVSLNLKEREVE